MKPIKARSSYVILKKIDSANSTNSRESKQFLDDINAQCSICTDLLLFPCTLGCGHSFCYNCLKNLYKHNNSDDEEDEEVEKKSKTYKESFYNNECFKATLGKDFKSSSKFNSKLLMNQDKLITHILNDSIYSSNCNGLKCPTCRENIQVLPKPNILLHKTLSSIFGELYEVRIQEYLSNYCEDFMLEQYERSERYKIIKELVSESIDSIEQAVSFDCLMESFNSYGPEEIVFCLSKLIKDQTFVAVKNMIISYNNYSIEFSNLLSSGQLTDNDINYLILSHPSFSVGNSANADKLKGKLLKRIKNTRTGILSLLDNENELKKTMRQFIVTHNLLDW